MQGFPVKLKREAERGLLETEPGHFEADASGSRSSSAWKAVSGDIGGQTGNEKGGGHGATKWELGQKESNCLH